MIVLGGWASSVVIDEIDAIEVIPKDMYAAISFSCGCKC